MNLYQTHHHRRQDDARGRRRLARVAPWWWLLLATTLLPACSGGPADPTAAQIAANNRGVGLMGYFDYEGARTVFAELVDRQPRWQAVKINLAIATLNRQEPGDEKRALALLAEVLDDEPDNLRALYNSAVLLLSSGATAQAGTYFRRVSDADPTDAYAAYYLGQSLGQAGDHAGALARYQQALQADPYLRSAYYGAFLATQRLKNRELARTYLDSYQRLDKNPRARLVQFKYTRMGPRSEAATVDAVAPAPMPAPVGDLFAAGRAFMNSAAAGDGAALNLLIDENRALAFATAGQGNALLDLRGRRATRAAMTGPGIRAAAWGDYDNDGQADMYLCRKGANQLWRNLGKDQWQDVTATTGTGGGAFDTVDCAFFDADHDGDLDLFLVNADGANELLNNNRDGSFRPIAAQGKLDGGTRASRQVLVADLDGDRDADIIVLHESPPHEVFINDRLWAYRAGEGFESFIDTPLRAVLAADWNADGAKELYGVDDQGVLRRWQADEAGIWQARTLGVNLAAAPGGARLAVGDLDGDGTPELIASDGDGFSVHELSATGASTVLRVDVNGDDPLSTWALWVDDAAAGPGLLGLHRSGRLMYWAPGPGRYPFAALRFSGLEDEAQSMRSNASGIGTDVAIRSGSTWSAHSTQRTDSGPGQSLQPLAVGLKGATQLDFVALTWSDGVFQTELGLKTGALHSITETQRQLSSCPVLFAWDGTGYRFVSDLLGVGGIGFLLAPGRYATARPRENFLLPAGLLKAQNGRLKLRIGEPMEEAAYIDSMVLRAWDLPPGWSLVLDERMGTGAPAPTGQALFYRHERQPRRATNDRGADVTDTIRAIDQRAAPVGPLDHRFIGRLRDEHVLTLEFGTALDGSRGRPVLVIDGWVKYPYPQTLFAAWQAGAAYRPLSVEARSAGRWRPLLTDFGYPAGMPRRMAVPLDGLPDGVDALRLRTNQEIYIDRVALVHAEALPRARGRALTLIQAQVRQAGFPRRLARAGRPLDFDYRRRTPLWDTRYLSGLYTAYGPATELVDVADDALAIIGSGDELQLEFDAPAPPPPGWTRRYVLEAHGWAKDMDLYTRDGGTVAPLPASGHPAGRRAALHARYNTRLQSGY